MEYLEHFDQRGHTYDWAMRWRPDARDQEFRQVVERADLRAGMRVADVPAGGGYMANYLPEGCIWYGHEPSAGFAGGTLQHGDTIESRNLLPLPWMTDSMDAAVSLAGVHHVADKRALFTELRRIVKDGGRLVLSDVESGSPQALFLDGYVGANNLTGHEGMYLDSATETELEDSGWRCLSSELVQFYWVFDSRDGLGTFCHNLFGLVSGSVSDTVAAVDSRLGIDELDDGRVGMRWALRTLVAT